jgi:hypothetical protein
MMRSVLFVSVLAAGLGAAQMAYAQSPAPTSLTTRALELIATVEAESAAAGGTTLGAMLQTTSRPEFVAFGRRVKASELPRIAFSRARTIHLRGHRGSSNRCRRSTGSSDRRLTRRHPHSRGPTVGRILVRGSATAGSALIRWREKSRLWLQTQGSADVSHR